MLRLSVAIILSLALVLVLAPPRFGYWAADAQQGEKPVTARPPASFTKHCSECHEVYPGAPESDGPNLWLIGSKAAGTSPFPEYSDAMKKSGIVWNADTLQTYMASPSQVVPGTTMDFRGLPDPIARKEIADYLISFRP